MKLLRYSLWYRRVYIPVFKPVDVLAFIDPKLILVSLQKTN